MEFTHQMTITNVSRKLFNELSEFIENDDELPYSCAVHYSGNIYVGDVKIEFCNEKTRERKLVVKKISELLETW